MKPAPPYPAAQHFLRSALRFSCCFCKKCFVLLAVFDGKEGKICDIVGHVEVLCVDDACFSPGQECAERMRTVAGEDELRGENHNPLVCKRSPVRKNELPHRTRNAGAVDGVAEPNRVRLCNQRFKIRRFFYRETGRASRMGEPLRDKPRIPRAGKIEYDHLLLLFARCS